MAARRLLLDTHILLWWRQDSRRLRRELRAAITAASTVYVSAASAWEAAIKAAIGRLRLEEPFAAHVAAAGFEPMPITFEQAAEAGGLPPHHGDPFDRMLVAQARIERLVLVTHDDVFDAYDVETLRA